MLPQPQFSPGATPISASLVERFIHQHGQLRPYKRHEAIYAAGDPSQQFYLISSGEVRLSRYTPEGRELTLEHLGPGSLFGEMEILLGKNRESQAVARTNLLVYVMECDTLMGMVDIDPKFGLWLTRRMSSRQARMENRLESLLFKSANGKVAQVLINLADRYGTATEEGTFIDYPITHQEIGNLIATTRETVSYAFMEFRREGLISTRQRKTIVHDMQGLAKLALT